MYMAHFPHFFMQKHTQHTPQTLKSYAMSHSTGNKRCRDRRTDYDELGLKPAVIIAG
jgi:hypothetical protein